MAYSGYVHSPQFEKIICGANYRGSLTLAAEFTIDQVAWHIETEGNPETREHIVWRFWSVVGFLQRHGLTTSPLAASINDIDDDFGISSADLTVTGLFLMKKVYDKWLAKVDRGMSPDDLSIFEAALKSL
jgi:hypothetical protein